MNSADQWKRYQRYLCNAEELGLTVDISRMHFDSAYLDEMEPSIQAAYQAMEELEKGAIANPGEKRMVGHYWLRSPQLAPTTQIAAGIEKTVADIKAFSARVHEEKKFTRLLLIGIGGSALGPMFVADALGDPEKDRMAVHFIDNTDPDGVARELSRLKGKLAGTLVIVTSKSGGTPDTRNGMLLVAAAFQAAGLDFAGHAVAITMAGSNLDRQSSAEGWLARFPMFDWVGGRTSELSAVGLLPAALQGLDIAGMLAGAAACDALTRNRTTGANPAALLALMWYKATNNGRGERDMVVLPYKDRLLLLSRYLQQLVMESLGKRLDLDGKRAEQGISVYGNKGSTDQHAFVQQLRDGVNNFFVIFLRVLESGGNAVEVEPGITAGDYLHGFLLGTRDALSGNERQSITITVRHVEARTVGMLIALFERAVGLYASLVRINAYDQPGVEAGKKAASAVLKVQSQLSAALGEQGKTADELALAIGAESVETAYLLLEHLAANGRARAAGAPDPAARLWSKV